MSGFTQFVIGANVFGLFMLFGSKLSTKGHNSIQKLYGIKDSKFTEAGDKMDESIEFLGMALVFFALVLDAVWVILKVKTWIFSLL